MKNTSKNKIANLIVCFFCLAVVGCSCKPDDEKADLEEVCFVGDSITFYWDLESTFPSVNAKKIAVSGAHVKDVFSWKISDCEGKRTFLLIGTNDIGWTLPTTKNSDLKRTAFLQEYMALVDEVHASTLMVVSILPRNFEKNQTPTVNSYIKTVNDALQDSLQVRNISYEYIDVFDLFIDQDDEIKYDYFKDGLHPNAKGYEVLAQEYSRYL